MHRSLISIFSLKIAEFFAVFLQNFAKFANFFLTNARDLEPGVDRVVRHGVRLVRARLKKRPKTGRRVADFLKRTDEESIEENEPEG